MKEREREKGGGGGGGGEGGGRETDRHTYKQTDGQTETVKDRETERDPCTIYTRTRASGNRTLDEPLSKRCARKKRVEAMDMFWT